MESVSACFKRKSKNQYVQSQKDWIQIIVIFFKRERNHFQPKTTSAATRRRHYKAGCQITTDLMLLPKAKLNPGFHYLTGGTNEHCNTQGYKMEKIDDEINSLAKNSFLKELRHKVTNSATHMPKSLTMKQKSISLLINRLAALLEKRPSEARPIVDKLLSIEI